MSTLIYFLIGGAIGVLSIIICSMICYYRSGVKDFFFDELEWPELCVFMFDLLAAIAVAVCLG